jgi:hypothetical protein
MPGLRNSLETGRHFSAFATIDPGVDAMTLFENPFYDTKLRESIFGEDQRWNPGRAGDGTHWRLPDEWDAIACANKEAADRLVDGLGRGPLGELYQSYPIMSLYRHYLEMRLKGIWIQLQQWDRLMKIWFGESDEQPEPKYNHQLMEVWWKVRALLDQIDSYVVGTDELPEDRNDLYDAIEARIREFSDIDQRATSFRYPVEKNGEPTPGVPLYKEELVQVKGVVDALDYHLGGISCGVHDISSQVCEALGDYRDWQMEYASEMYADQYDLSW